jgi:hypothetical protein
MKKQQYRLVDGTITNSFKKYCKSWYDLAKPIEEELGLRLESFDPSINFIDKEKAFKQTINLPVWFMKRLNVILEDKKKSKDEIFIKEHLDKIKFWKNQLKFLPMDKKEIEIVLEKLRNEIIKFVGIK